MFNNNKVQSRKICRILNSFSRLNNIIQDCSNYKSNIYDVQYKNLIEISPEPIFILQRDKIIYMNNSAQNLLNAENIESVRGKSIIDFVEREYKSKAVASIRNLFNKNSDTIIEEVKIKKLTGEVCFVQGLAIETIYNNNAAVLTMLRDITDIKEKENLLKEAKEEAEKAEELKSQFLAQMSHEIRSPLNTIITSVQMFKEELMSEVNDEQNEYFKVIKSASHRIIRTVDLILTSSTLQKDLYQPIYQDVDLYLIINELINEYRYLAHSKNISLKFKCSTENQVITADQYSVTQILSNLIDNSIKYTHEGQVEIILRKSHEQNFVIDIVDTGIGISKNFLPKIFDEFSQETTGYTRCFEGTGLGMSVVKKFAGLNNIEIKISSKVGIGTKYSLHFTPYLNSRK
ncbi:MAG: PAS domain-containing sensor histidine kinase [Ignavibacteriae bacterium]|nr:PAS domain-containing sensor histidine kinase [Ignavibacteriota bacterium]NOG97904.1 PAS domain-containing sensor histidine kinase [Ignavibacteriota bacterium]